MFDVLVFIFEHFQNLGHFPSRHYITEKLDEAGFDHEEIIDSLNCLDELFNTDGQYIKSNSISFKNKMRVFSQEEIKNIPIDVRGYLHFLQQQQVINFFDIELVIHVIMKLNKEEIDLETVKVITLIVARANEARIPILVGDDLLSVLYEKGNVH